MRIAHVTVFRTLTNGYTGMVTGIIHMTAKSIERQVAKLIRSATMGSKIRNAQTCEM